MENGPLIKKNELLNQKALNSREKLRIAGVHWMSVGYGQHPAKPGEGCTHYGEVWFRKELQGEVPWERFALLYCFERRVVHSWMHEYMRWGAVHSKKNNCTHVLLPIGSRFIRTSSEGRVFNRGLRTSGPRNANWSPNVWLIYGLTRSSLGHSLILIWYTPNLPKKCSGTPQEMPKKRRRRRNSKSVQHTGSTANDNVQTLTIAKIVQTVVANMYVENRRENVNQHRKGKSITNRNVDYFNKNFTISL